MKKFIWITLLVLVVLITGGAFVVQDITFAQYAGAKEMAQTALDTTVLQKIDDVTPYTGGMNGFAIHGHDKAGRPLYVWTQDGKVVAMQYDDKGLSRDKAILAAQKPVWAKQHSSVIPDQQLQSVVDVIHATPGPVLLGAKTQYANAPSRFVWEIYGHFANGQTGYTYLDFASGQVLWQIALDDKK